MDILIGNSLQLYPTMPVSKIKRHNEDNSFDSLLKEEICKHCGQCSSFSKQIGKDTFGFCSTQQRKVSEDYCCNRYIPAKPILLKKEEIK